MFQRKRRTKSHRIAPHCSTFTINIQESELVALDLWMKLPPSTKVELAFPTKQDRINKKEEVSSWRNSKLHQRTTYTQISSYFKHEALLFVHPSLPACLPLARFAGSALDFGLHGWWSASWQMRLNRSDRCSCKESFTCACMQNAS